MLVFVTIFILINYFSAGYYISQFVAQ